MAIETSFYDWQKSSAYAQTHCKRGTKRGVDNLIVNRDLSYNIRIELEDMTNQFLNYEDIFNIYKETIQKLILYRFFDN